MALSFVPDFYSAIVRKEERIHTEEGVITMKTPTFYQYLMLSYIKSKTQEDCVDKARSLCEMLSVLIGSLNQISISDIPSLVEAMVKLTEVPTFAWTRPIELKEKGDFVFADELVEYRGRDVAFIVTVLSRAFGWTADYILHTLTYYEACAYIQEALLYEHERDEFAYTLSETGFKKSGDTYVKVPFPPLSWIKQKPKRVKGVEKEIPQRFRPDGVVVDFSEYAKTGEIRQYEIKDNSSEDVDRERVGDDNNSSKTS